MPSSPAPSDVRMRGFAQRVEVATALAWIDRSAHATRRLQPDRHKLIGSRWRRQG